MQFLTTLVMLTAFAASVVEVSAGPLDFTPQGMLSLVNKFRAGKRLPPFAMHPVLNKAAQGHSQVQANNQRNEHSFPGEPELMQRCSIDGASWNYIRENIAYGQQTMKQAMDFWTNSPVHYENLVAKSTHFGSGLAIGSNGVPYWTQNIGLKL
ncbi:CAP domain-containing protein [Syncephalis fuscata]|nr:CAP domain-containing protein [Syncephalis fuscata]